MNSPAVKPECDASNSSLTMSVVRTNRSADFFPSSRQTASRRSEGGPDGTSLQQHAQRNGSPLIRFGWPACAGLVTLIPHPVWLDVPVDGTHLTKRCRRGGQPWTSAITRPPDPPQPRRAASESNFLQPLSPAPGPSSSNVTTWPTLRPSAPGRFVRTAKARQAACVLQQRWPACA